MRDYSLLARKENLKISDTFKLTMRKNLGLISCGLWVYIYSDFSFFFSLSHHSFLVSGTLKTINAGRSTPCGSF